MPASSPGAMSLLAVTPFIVLAGTAVVIMLAAGLTKHHGVFLGLSLAGLAGTLATVGVVAARNDRRATILLSMDDYALYFIGLATVIAGAVILLSYAYLEETERRRADYYVLVVLATLGGTILVASSHFASLFLGLEVLSVSLYGLIAYPRARLVAVEAGLKYLIMAASTAAFLLLGIAFIYAASGTLVLADVSSFAGGVRGWTQVFYVGGLVLLFTGIGFKLAVVPFHMWTPDVYEGAPAPVTGFVATVSKAAVLALLVRYAAKLDPGGGGPFVLVLMIVSVASMVVGNLLALLQHNLKRLLAYSSISHLGYLLVALLAGGAAGRVAVGFYLAVYMVTILAAFGVVAVLTKGEEEPESLEAYRGLGRTKPWLSGVLTLALLSLAGIPLTGGFIGKFLIVQAGAGEARWALIVILVLTSVVGLFYYLRVVVILYGGTRGLAPEPGGGRGFNLAAAVLAVLTVIILFLGLYPQPLLHLIKGATATLG